MRWDRFVDVLPIITLIAGFVLARLDSSRRERVEAKERRALAEAEFQRETLLALQEAVQHLGSLPPVDHVLGVGADEWSAARMEVTKLTVRVRDRRTRASARLLQTMLDRPQAFHAADQMEIVESQLEAYEELHERIGWLLRQGTDALVHPEPMSFGERQDRERELAAYGIRLGWRWRRWQRRLPKFEDTT